MLFKRMNGEKSHRIIQQIDIVGLADFFDIHATPPS